MEQNKGDGTRARSSIAIYEMFIRTWYGAWEPVCTGSLLVWSNVEWYMDKRYRSTQVYNGWEPVQNEMSVRYTIEPW